MTDINTIQNCSFRLYANERDMHDAETKILGTRSHHAAQCSWQAFDEDDDRPDVVDYYIEIFPGHSDDDLIAHMWKVAAELGAKCWLECNISTPAFRVVVSTAQKPATADVYARVIESDAEKRISTAMAVLRGEV